MKKLFTIVLLLTHYFSFAQPANKQSCKVEFYLLKKVIPNKDTTKELRQQFNATLNDLQDTAFIKDGEILNYTIQRYTQRSGQSDIKISEVHSFKVQDAAAKRVRDLKPPLCCGRQFAVVVNGQICYTGYFWNYYS